MLEPITLKNDIKELVRDLEDQVDKDKAREEFAEKLGTLIPNYVSKAQVNVNPGIVVQVTPSTGTGSTTSVGIGELS
jgi:hypothetical protein